MKQRLFLLNIMIFSFLFITGCSNSNSSSSNSNMTPHESIQVQKEENKLDNNMRAIKDLKNSIYKFITDDIKSNGGHVKDFDLDNMNLELKKARNEYNDINFDLLKTNYEYRKAQDQENKTNFNELGLEYIQKNYSNALDLYEQMIKLGNDGSYSNKDYTKIHEYSDKIADELYMATVYNNNEYDNFFKFYILYGVNVYTESKLTDIKNKIKEAGYDYKFDNESTDTTNTLIVFDKNRKDSVHFLFKHNLLNTVFYYVDDNKDTFLSYTIFASSTGVKYYGCTPKLLQYKEFYSFDKQYEFLKEIKNAV